MSLLSNYRGWTPIPDEITAAHGLTTGAVYGVILRFSLMREGACRASQSTIARKLNLTRETVNRHIRRLLEAGLITDHCASRSGKPHTYSIRHVTNALNNGASKSQLPVRKAHNTCDQRSHKESINKNQLKDRDRRAQPTARRTENSLIDIIQQMKEVQNNDNNA